MCPPWTLISTECHPRGRTTVSDCAMRAWSSCSQHWTRRSQWRRRVEKRSTRLHWRLHRLSCVCGSVVDNSVAPALKDCATSRTGRSALQNVTFECARVKTRKCKSSDNLALRGPSLMLYASRARCAKLANSDCATAKFRGARTRVCYHSPSKVTSVLVER